MHRKAHPRRKLDAGDFQLAITLLQALYFQVLRENQGFKLPKTVGMAMNSVRFCRLFFNGKQGRDGIPL